MRERGAGRLVVRDGGPQMAHLMVHGSSHAGDEQAPLLGQGVFSQQATSVEPRDDVHGIRVVTLPGDELLERAGGSEVLCQPQGDPRRFAEVMVLEEPGAGSG